MALIEEQDFILIKNAVYREEKMVQQSGNLVVTPNRIILNVIQTIDPLDALSGSSGAGIKENIQEIKKDSKQLKKDFKNISAYGKKKKEIEHLAQTAAGLEDFEKKVASMGTMNAKSINLSTSDVKEYKIGFFKGFQIYLNDGSVYKIRTGKLGKIKAILNK